MTNNLLTVLNKTEYRMKNLISVTFGLCLLFSVSDLSGQCATWDSSPRIDDAKNAHSIYRQALKIKDNILAFENWKIAYEIAPSADGKRDYHFTDGAAMYKRMFEEETDEAKKKEYSSRAVQLYDEAISCYESKGIALKCNTDECIAKKIGQSLH